MNLALIQENPVEVRLMATSRELCEAASTVTIMTRNDLSEATDLVKTIKTRTKEIEEERVRLVKPFNDGVKAINSRFKAMTSPLEEAETEIKGRMLSFQKEEQQRAIAEAARLEAIRLESIAKEAEQANDIALDRPDIPAFASIIEPIAPVHRVTTYGQTGAVSTVKKIWAFEVTDIKALAASRPDLVLSNEVEINREIRGKGGEIAGLRIYEKEIMQVR